jgi:UDP-glucose 4-epimerase
VRDLVRAGHDVVVLDNLSNGHRAAIDPRAAFIHADLADVERLKKTLRDGFDAVMHFAASINVGESVEQPLLYYRNNVANSLLLLEAMRDAGVRRIVFSSTCAVYGVPPAQPIVETMPTDPINPYGRSKLAIEWMLRDCASAWGLGSVSLRYFNAAGAAADASIGEDHRPEFHLIPLVLQVAQGRRAAIRVFGTDYPTSDGSCVRDYVHVEDLASAHTRAVEWLRPGQVAAFNVGTGRGRSVLEVIAAARTVTGHSIPTEVGPRRAGDPPELYADPSRIQAALGWVARYTDIGDTIRTAWDWMRCMPNGYEE